jgi:hypothetical protein
MRFQSCIVGVVIAYSFAGASLNAQALPEGDTLYLHPPADSRRVCGISGAWQRPLATLADAWHRLPLSDQEALKGVADSAVYQVLTIARAFVGRQDSIWRTAIDTAYLTSDSLAQLYPAPRSGIPIDTTISEDAIRNALSHATASCAVDDTVAMPALYVQSSVEGFPYPPTVHITGEFADTLSAIERTLRIALLAAPDLVLAISNQAARRVQDELAVARQIVDSIQITERKAEWRSKVIRHLLQSAGALIVIGMLVGGAFFIRRKSTSHRHRENEVASRPVTWTDEEDIHEPVAIYRQYLKERHAENVRAFFDALVAESGVNGRENQFTVSSIRRYQAVLDGASRRRLLWKLVRFASVIAAFVLAVMGFFNPWFFLGCAALIAITIKTINPIIAELNDRVDDISAIVKAKMEEAWAQMKALNDLHHWSALTLLVSETLPRISFDEYLSEGRLDEFRSEFGWNTKLGNNTSVKFVHSGALNGNPFVLARTLTHRMGTKTYHGSLTIHWTERVKASDGRWERRERSETLRASVTKPFPEFLERTHMFYGNEAAPDLSFSRTPTIISVFGEGRLGRLVKWAKVKWLESRSRRGRSASSYTMLQNTDFEALFGATDRDHEVQFRLLFTPLAQQEMLHLLREKDVAFGDQFSFTKRRKINRLELMHMHSIDISGDPILFHNYDLAEARRFFNEYHNQFFRHLYFGLAPLLCVPLYQQHRSNFNIYRNLHSKSASSWEHESIANYFGESTFAHPNCITRSILKTQATRGADGCANVQVRSVGYGGVQRRDYVRVRGGDGEWHLVPVDWVEYFPVENSAEIIVSDGATSWREAPAEIAGVLCEREFASRGIETDTIVARRGIAASLRR